MYVPNLNRFGRPYLKMWHFEPYGVSDLVISVLYMSKTPKWIFTYSNGVVCCVKNRNPIALMIHRFAFYAIYINLYTRPIFP